MREVIVVRPGHRRAGGDFGHDGVEPVAGRQVHLVGSDRLGARGVLPTGDRQQRHHRKPQYSDPATPYHAAHACADVRVSEPKRSMPTAPTKMSTKAARLSTSAMVWANRKMVQSRW